MKFPGSRSQSRSDCLTFAGEVSFSLFALSDEELDLETYDIPLANPSLIKYKFD